MFDLVSVFTVLISFSSLSTGSEILDTGLTLEDCRAAVVEFHADPEAASIARNLPEGVTINAISAFDFRCEPTA